MLLIVLIGVALLTVPVAGGHLGHLLDVRLRGFPILIGALAVQVLVVSIVPDAPTGLLTSLHIVTYLVALGFVAVNLHLRGLWVVGLGGALNFAAIVANGGVMPASTTALRAAGLPVRSHSFENSAAVHHARLAFLGDVFAIPASWPLPNVFSLGDILIAVGVAGVIHQVCASRLTASGRTAHRRSAVSEHA